MYPWTFLLKEWGESHSSVPGGNLLLISLPAPLPVHDTREETNLSFNNLSLKIHVIQK